jgi:tetratricopeptide (TPR) repeat protein
VQALIALLILVALVLAAAWIVSRNRKRHSRKRLRDLGRLNWRSKPKAESPFVGRQAEIDAFAQQIRLPWSGEGPPAKLVVVHGPPGMGKAALLARFRDVCLEREHPLCGPTIDLAEGMSLELVLSRIAHELQSLGHDAFAKFFDAIDQYRDKLSGTKSTGEQALELGRTAAKGGALSFPGGSAVGAALESEQADAVVRFFEGPSNIEVVENEFAGAIANLAARSTTDRTVLLFANLDRAPAAGSGAVIREWLIPTLASDQLLVVVSTDDSDARRLLRRVEPSLPMPLSKLTNEEARQFVVQRMGLQSEVQIQDILDRSEGIPGRLQGYLEYLRQHPDLATSEERIPEEAHALAASLYPELQKLPGVFLQKVVLAAAPLRWFNAALLDLVAEVAQLEPSPEEGDLRASALIRERSLRPSWIVRVGNGWGFDSASRRLELLDEVRRLYPDTCRQIHRAAAAYHRKVLESWGGADPHDGEPPTPDLFSSPSETQPLERLEDTAYVNSLAEWLYHLLSYAPDRAFPVVVETALEALVSDNEPAAPDLLRIGSEVAGRTPHRLYLKFLSEAASALKESRYKDAIDALKHLSETGAPSTLARAEVGFLLGTSYWAIGEESETEGWIERAAADFAVLDGDRAAVRGRSLIATWSAMLMVQKADRYTGKARRVMRRALDEAEHLGEPALIAELHRADALLWDTGHQPERALAGFRTALEIFREAGMPKEVAGVRRNRADVFRAQKEYESARQELDQAASIYRNLGDPVGETEIILAQVALDLDLGHLDQANARRDDAMRHRAGDASFHNSLGLRYFAAGSVEQAEASFAEAARLSPNTPLYHSNQAIALSSLGRHGEAAAALERAVESAPGDATVTLQLALEYRDGDQREEARAALRAAADKVITAARRSDADARVETLSESPQLQRTFHEILDALDPIDCVVILERSVEEFPDDHDLHFRLGQLLRTQGIEAQPLDRWAVPPTPISELERAIELATKAKADQDARSRYYVELAAAQADARDWQQAEKSVAIAASLGGDPRGDVLDRIRRNQQRDSWSGPHAGQTARAIEVQVATDLLPWVSDQTEPGKDLYAGMLPAMRTRLREVLGVEFPAIQFGIDESLDSGNVQMLIWGIPRVRLVVPPDEYLAGCTPSECLAAGVPGRPAEAQWGDWPASWVLPDAAQTLADRGIETWDPRGVIVAALAQQLKRHAHLCIGIQQIAELLDNRPPETDGRAVLPPQDLPRLTSTCRLLLRGGLDLLDVDALLEAFARADPRAPADAIAADVRRRLVPRAVLGRAGADGRVRIGKLRDEVALSLVTAAQPGRSLVLTPSADHALGVLQRQLAEEGDPVLLVDRPEVRAFLQDRLRDRGEGCLVVTEEELAGVPPDALVDIRDQRAVR